MRRLLITGMCSFLKVVTSVGDCIYCLEKENLRKCAMHIGIKVILRLSCPAF